jgi:hypothetical protein
VRAARQVVGLYGDPDVTWCILLELELSEAVARSDVAERLGAVLAAHPHLGARVSVESLRRLGTAVAPEDRERLANRPFGDHEALVRVALSDDGTVLLLAAHHGSIDGLGLVGLAGLLLNLPLGTSARGLARTGGEPGFVRGTLRRLHEVVLRPPERFRARTVSRAAHGDVLAHTDLPALRRGTAALAWAGLSTVRRWNGPTRRLRQPVIALGVSRRPGTAPIVPDRDTAYSRLPAGDLAALPELVERLAATDPEPDFPVTDAGGLGPALLRLLASRLGATTLVSNLGMLDDSRVRAARFWPVASGQAGVAFGLASTGGTTTLTVRARGRWFRREDASRMLALATDALVGSDPSADGAQ